MSVSLLKNYTLRRAIEVAVIVGLAVYALAGKHEGLVRHVCEAAVLLLLVEISLDRPAPLKALSGMVAALAALGSAVYAAGMLLVPYTDAVDKAILAAINPDTYTPGLDEFFRALTDYSNFLITVPLLSWMSAYGLYRLMPRLKRVWTGALVVETLVFLSMIPRGKLWWNSGLIGANYLFFLFCVIAFGAAVCAFHRMDDAAMRRCAGVFWIMALSSICSGVVVTERIKEAVARPRPFHEANKPWNEGVRTIPEEHLTGTNSFPSGHTSGTFALLTPWFWFVRSRKGRAGLLGWSVLQGVSRVYTAAHFPFCCLMGGILGFGIGTIIFFGTGGPALRRSIEEVAKPAT